MKVWLESRFDEINGRLSQLEAQLGQNGHGQPNRSSSMEGRLRPALLKTISQLGARFNGQATSEQLSEALEIRKSVVSGYLAKLVSLGILERKYNHTPAPGRYLFAFTDTGGRLFIDMTSRVAPTRKPKKQ